MGQRKPNKSGNSRKMIIFLYIFCMVVANLTIAFFGPWFSPINAFIFIGLDMVLRDKLHDKWKGKNLYRNMLGLILTASVITFILNPAAGLIAIASVVAFVSSMLVNTIVYQFVIDRKWMFRSNTSNAFGSAVDSLVFPTVAFGSFMWDIVLLQFIAKVGGGFMWSWAFKKFWGAK